MRRVPEGMVYGSGEQGFYPCSYILGERSRTVVAVPGQRRFLSSPILDLSHVRANYLVVYWAFMQSAAGFTELRYVPQNPLTKQDMFHGDVAEDDPVHSYLMSSPLSTGALVRVRSEWNLPLTVAFSGPTFMGAWLARLRFTASDATATFQDVSVILGRV